MLGPSKLERAKLTLDSFQTISDLAKDTLNGNYSEINKPSIFSRALVWKLTILKINKINPQNGHREIELNLSNILKLRHDYRELLDEFQIPWNQLNKQSEYYQKSPNDHTEGFDITDDLNKKRKIQKIRVSSDPLSSLVHSDISDSYNNIKQQESDVQTLEAIVADVDRLFPEYPRYFIQNISNRRLIITILFLWCQLNAIPYYQGLHELCGVIYMVFLSESIPQDSPNKSVKQMSKLDNEILLLMDPKAVADDTFSAFSILMKPIITKYYSDGALLQETIMFDLKLHQCDKFLYYLFKNKFKLDSRIWLMRYLRLVLIREVGLSTSLKLWDRLICFSFLQNPFQSDIDITLLIPFIILIMLSLIKQRLIVSDYGDVLYLLLHYPVQKKDFLSGSTSLKNSIILIRDSDSEDTTNNGNNDDFIVHDEGHLSHNRLSHGKRSEDDGLALDDGKDFTYIEQNHQRQRLSESSLSQNSSGSISSSRSSNTCGTEGSNVALPIKSIVLNSIRLFRMTDSELQMKGAKILESYSNMHNKWDGHGGISTQKIQHTTNSSILENLFSKAHSWGHGRSNSSIGKAVDNISTKLEKMTISREEIQPKQDLNRDFDRTRVEMLLQKRVKETLNHGSVKL